jgi:hypothetical protein
MGESQSAGDLFKSVWGILAIIVTIVSLTFGVISFLYKTFPTVVNVD